MIKSMDMDILFGLVETNTKEATLMINVKEKAK